MERPLEHSSPVAPARRHLARALLCVVLIFAAIAPSLPWLEFSSSSENLNLATAMEIRRTGNWLVPTLHGETRLAKPPLTAWVTAALLTDGLMQRLSSPDADVRSEALRSLAWRVRLLALTVGCLTLLVIFFTANAIVEPEVALLSLVVAGTSLLFLRFCRSCGTDLPLMLFVSLTNLLLVLGIARKLYWLGFVGAGVTLALAMMTKGPVSLLQSLLPVALWLVMLRRRPPWKPIVIGLIAFLVVGLAWYAVVWLRTPNAAEIWYRELTGYQDEEERGRKPYEYLQFIPYMTPWCIFFPIGIAIAAIRRDNVDRLLLSLLLVPLIIMSFFSDRYARYMLPMLPAAAILTARCLWDHLRALRWIWTDRMTNIAHWLVLACVGIGFPLGATGPLKELVRVDGSPWLTQSVGYQAAIFAFVAIALGIILQRRVPHLLVVVAACVFLGVSSLFIAGYSDSDKGRSTFRSFAEMIWRDYGDAPVYNGRDVNRRPPTDIAVYLNRPLPWIEDPSTLSAGIRPQLLLLHQKKGQPEPTAPPGWSRVSSQQRGGDTWWLYALPAL